MLERPPTLTEALIALVNHYDITGDEEYAFPSHGEQPPRHVAKAWARVLQKYETERRKWAPTDDHFRQRLTPKPRGRRRKLP